MQFISITLRSALALALAICVHSSSASHFGQTDGATHSLGDSGNEMQRALQKELSDAASVEWPTIIYSIIDPLNGNTSPGTAPADPQKMPNLGPKLSPFIFYIPFHRRSQLSVKVQNKIVHLTEHCKDGSPLVIEMKVERFEENGAPVFAEGAEAYVRKAEQNELGSLMHPKMPHIKLFFQFNKTY